MKKLNNTWLITTMTTVLLLLSACGGSGESESNSEGDTNGNEPNPSSEEAISLRLAHSGSEEHQYHTASTKFKELIEVKSGGSITVELFPNATLGSEPEIIEQVIDGTIDMAPASADSVFANTVPEMNVFGIPYLFRDRDHVFATLDGEVGQQLLETINENNLVGLGFWDLGFRHLTNNSREIRTPEDVSGLSIRVQASAVWEAHMNAIGASPTPVNFHELYSSLDQGVVDGQENPLLTIETMLLYEVQDYLSLTAHTYGSAAVFMSNAAWDKLNEEQQELVREAMAETTEYQRELVAERETNILETFEEAGMTITEDVDIEAFREATKDVKDVISQQVPQSLIDDILSVE